ncbi:MULTISPECIES: hypothetical protein [Burkholderia]|uniref:hypothetical protein n=1 Tax=Burkholderia TaxID=32008 RepID=UPI001FC898E6|nr:hypothetical protein [Burkholderia multivorans]MCA8174571.1 hypothetical protein [Burkholderia multivorans]MCA8222846.1 hypothetical protein [Burkholderia multivorans]MDR8877955.1 hypothetical protein [Burkholderia multivorans]MDR8884255.1 hypothetical protein [Burkholderia multivorans]MDR8889741.1 hypothetical protein [Burkholderia multivorans]
MAKFRCRAGDLARVIHSINPVLVGRIVLVTHSYDVERWAVTVFGDPVFGVTACDGRPIITNDWAFRDSSLLPLRGDEPNSRVDELEVYHA